MPRVLSTMSRFYKTQADAGAYGCVIMSTRATSKVDIKSWNEETTLELEGGRKLTRASITCAHSGAIQGESSLEYLMVYRADGTASYVGLEHIKGTLSGKNGGFTVQHTGEWQDNAAHTSLSIVPGSGTGDLEGIRGTGVSNATHDELPYTLEYDLA
jgi:hypothetical protein